MFLTDDGEFNLNLTPDMPVLEKEATYNIIFTCKRPHLFCQNSVNSNWKMFIFCYVALMFFLLTVLFRFVIYILNAFIYLNFFYLI